MTMGQPWRVTIPAHGVFITPFLWAGGPWWMWIGFWIQAGLLSSRLRSVYRTAMQMSMGLGPDRINSSLTAIKWKVSKGPREENTAGRNGDIRLKLLCLTALWCAFLYAAEETWNVGGSGRNISKYLYAERGSYQQLEQGARRALLGPDWIWWGPPHLPSARLSCSWTPLAAWVSL